MSVMRKYTVRNVKKHFGTNMFFVVKKLFYRQYCIITAPIKLILSMMISVTFVATFVNNVMFLFNIFKRIAIPVICDTNDRLFKLCSIKDAMS